MAIKFHASSRKLQRAAYCTATKYLTYFVAGVLLSLIIAFMAAIASAAKAQDTAQIYDGTVQKRAMAILMDPAYVPNYLDAGEQYSLKDYLRPESEPLLLPRGPVKSYDARLAKEGEFVKFNLSRMTYSIVENPDSSLRFNVFPRQKAAMLTWTWVREDYRR